MTLTAAQQQEVSSSPGGGLSDYGQEGSGAAAGDEESAAALAAATALEQGSLPPHWYVYTDTRGVFYYHNPYLNITQWERPPGAASLSHSPKNNEAVSSSTITTEEEEHDACTLNLSAAAAAADLRRGVGGEAGSTRGHGRDTRTTRATGSRIDGSNGPSDGFLSLASTTSSPLDMRQRSAQQQQQLERLHGGATISTTTAAEHVFFSHLASDPTLPGSKRLSHHGLYDGMSPAGHVGDGGSSAATATAAAGGSNKRSSSSEDISWILRCCGCINFYVALQQLFAVTTDDIYLRLRFALIPHGKLRALLGGSSRNNNDNDGRGAPELLKRPDMYGPFWVATTLVVLAFACSNFPSLLFPAGAAGAAADLRHLGQAAAAVYGCFLLPPVAVWAALYYYGPQRGNAADSAAETAAGTRTERDADSNKASPPALEQLLCLQGYAFTPLCTCSIVLLLLQIFPTHTIVTVLKWMAVGGAGAGAAIFLFQQLRQLLRAQPLHIKGCCFVLLIGAVLLLLLILMRFASLGCPQQQVAGTQTGDGTLTESPTSSSAAAGNPTAASAATTHSSVDRTIRKDIDVSSGRSGANRSSLSGNTTTPEEDTEGIETGSRHFPQPPPALLHLDKDNTSSIEKAPPALSSVAKPVDAPAVSVSTELSAPGSNIRSSEERETEAFPSP